MRAPTDLPDAAAEILARLRRARPRVHCITNGVAQAYTANVLLAAGAVPSMTVAVDEVAEFVAGADALLVNLGTMNPERHESAGIAVQEAREEDVPWVLDPVFVDRSTARLAFARTLIEGRPHVVRLNAAEFSTLAGAPADDVAPVQFASERATVVALTGQADLVADPTRRVTIANGDPMMTRVTAMGCAGSALIAACLAVEPDPWLAAAAGVLLIGIAGEVAAARAAGPGSLAVGVLDAVYALDRAVILQRARVS